MIYSLTGSNAYLRNKKLAELKNSFAKTHGRENIETKRGEEITAEELPSLLQGATLFSSHRMVVIYDLSVNKELQEQFLKLLEEVSDEIEVILVESQLDKRTVFYKSLKKLTEFHEFEQPQEFELQKWVNEYAKEQGGKIDSASARLLVEFIGIDQQRLAHEVEKLINYQPEITKQTIENLVERRPQSTVFQLLEYALSNQQEKAMKTLENLEKAFEDPFQITNLLIWQIQVLAVVKSAGNKPDSEIAKEAKINPFVVSKTKNLAKKIEKRRLQQIIDAVAELDSALKTTSASPWRSLEAAILSF